MSEKETKGTGLGKSIVGLSAGRDREMEFSNSITGTKSKWILQTLMLAISVMLLGVFMLYLIAKSTAPGDTLMQPRDISELQDFTTISEMAWHYSPQTDWLTAKRDTYDGRVSPMYDPQNYVFRAAVGENSVILTATLDDVRLVYTGEDGIALRAKGDDSSSYIEFNTPPEVYEQALTDEFYTDMDMYQIIFIQQYLSDRYLNLQT